MPGKNVWRGPEREGHGSAFRLARHTIDIDLQIVPDQDRLLRAIPELKEELELACTLLLPRLFRIKSVFRRYN